MVLCEPRNQIVVFNSLLHNFLSVYNLIYSHSYAVKCYHREPPGAPASRFAVLTGEPRGALAASLVHFSLVYFIFRFLKK